MNLPARLPACLLGKKKKCVVVSWWSTGQGRGKGGVVKWGRRWMNPGLSVRGQVESSKRTGLFKRQHTVGSGQIRQVVVCLTSETFHHR